MAIAVPRKGADAEGYAAKTLSENISWLGHAKIGIRSDNEPAMFQLVSSATNLLRLGGMNVTNEGSPPYDAQANGAAESSVRLIKGQLRAIQLGLERELHSHVPVGHPIMTWMARHAATVRTVYVIGADGQTAWQRAWGATCKIKLVDFGEVTRYKCRAQEGYIGNSQFKWGIAVWLGIDGRTGQHI